MTMPTQADEMPTQADEMPTQADDPVLRQPPSHPKGPGAEIAPIASQYRPICTPSLRAPNPGAPVPPLVPPAKKARFRILLYTGPYYKAFYVPATSIGRRARLFLVIQKENFLKKIAFLM